MDFDLIVIGSGPGGYHAAIRAAQLGLKTAVVEKGDVGGVCLNIGCIPTKALLHVASQLEGARAASANGITFADPEVNLSQVMTWKDGVVSKLTGGISALFKGNKVELISGEAVFESATSIKVGDKSYSAGKFIIATGSRPIQIPGFETDGEKVVDSTGALVIQEVPERFLAIGGSAIGLEFADVYNAFGSQVTVVEMQERIVPTADKDATRDLAKSLKEKGIDIRTSTKSVSQKAGKNGIDVVLEGKDGKQETITVDRILVAVGRRPNTEGVGLEAAGVELDQRGFVKVNQHMQSNQPNIYAIGDVAGNQLLAHKAMKEGLVAAEHAAAGKAAYDTIVPSVIYTSPELASVGMTEAEAKEAGHKVRVGRFPLAASGRAMALGVNSGLVKVIGDEDTDLILGVHIVSPSAGELIAEATLAIEMGTTLTDMSLVQHPHPTLSEGLMEAAEQAHGMAIHVSNRRK